MFTIKSTDPFKDYSIKCGDVDYKVHAIVLYNTSTPLAETIYSKNFKQELLDLSDHSPRSVELFIKSLYKEKVDLLVSDLDENELVSYLTLLDMYRVKYAASSVELIQFGIENWKWFNDLLPIYKEMVVDRSTHTFPARYMDEFYYWIKNTSLIDWDNIQLPSMFSYPLEQGVAMRVYDIVKSIPLDKVKDDFAWLVTNVGRKADNNIDIYNEIDKLIDNNIPTDIIKMDIASNPAMKLRMFAKSKYILAGLMCRKMYLEENSTNDEEYAKLVKIEDALLSGASALKEDLISNSYNIDI